MLSLFKLFPFKDGFDIKIPVIDASIGPAFV